MSEWCLYGSDRREYFENNLDAYELAHELRQYQLHLGKDFKIQDLLFIYEIKSRALIAEAINDVPEFLLDQIGKASHSVDLSFGISDGLDRIAEAIE